MEEIFDEEYWEAAANGDRTKYVAFVTTSSYVEEDGTVVTTIPADALSGVLAGLIKEMGYDSKPTSCPYYKGE